MTLEEMLRLQGMNPTEFIQNVPDKAVGEQLGNAMRVNVIERLLLNIFQSTNLSRKTNLTDRWKSGEALNELLCDRSKRILNAFASPSKIRYSKLRCGEGCRHYIVDSGASYHMIDIKSLTAKELATRRPVRRTINLQTANGSTSATEEVLVKVQDLKFFVRALVLK